jgi:aminopeptidase-like protein
LIHNDLYNLAKKLFPICRSITGQGVRDTLKILNEVCELQIKEVSSGYKAFDWVIPQEWEISDAYIIDPNGVKIVDFKKNNLHVVGYSIPIDIELSLEELKKHLYYIEDLPDAIPYITSYYKENWGFCISYNQWKNLKNGIYKIKINSRHFNGKLNYGELIIKGKSNKEVLISTYICHPSMANNELSGPVVSIYLARWLKDINPYYTYRFIYIPETIGSIVYLSKNLNDLKKNVICGFNLTCIGDNYNYSFLNTRYGDTLTDKLIENVFSKRLKVFNKYSYIERGSDERQFCSPGIDLPIVTIMRSKFGEYKEYHTSLDDLNFISEEGLEGGYKIVKECISVLEENKKFITKFLCEPQLSKRNLYPDISTLKTRESVKTLMNIIAYSDGKNDLIDLSNLLNIPAVDLIADIKLLEKNKIIQNINERI